MWEPFFVLPAQKRSNEFSGLVRVLPPILWPIVSLLATHLVFLYQTLTAGYSAPHLRPGCGFDSSMHYVNISCQNFAAELWTEPQRATLFCSSHTTIGVMRPATNLAPNHERHR